MGCGNQERLREREEEQGVERETEKRERRERWKRWEGREVMEIKAGRRGGVGKDQGKLKGKWWEGNKEVDTIIYQGWR